MKLPILTEKYNIVVTLTLCVITLFSSCNDDDNDPCGHGNNGEIYAKSKTTLILESFNPQDYGNEGNASDIFLRCKLSGTLDRFKKLRFILKSSPSGFNLVKALTLPKNSYVEIDVDENIEVSFPQSLKDADGRSISEGKSYAIFILGVPSPCSAVSVLIEGSKKLTLIDEIVVTTPKLKSTLAAMEDISIDEAYNLYISGGFLSPSSLFKVTPDGTVTTLSTTLSNPVGNTLDDNGNLYVTNFASLDINFIL